MTGETARISPTAHYTGYVWARNGLSVDRLVTLEGAVIHRALRPFQPISRALCGGNSLDTVLLHRHATIDALLEEAITSGGVRRVLEVAGGFSARGLRVATAHPEVRYVEGDLAAMAARKRRLLRDVETPANHAVVALDALQADGALSVEAVIERELPGSGPVVVITEGLLNYFDRATVELLWQRVRRALESAGGGVYLADLHVADETLPYALSRAFIFALGAFARGEIHMHFRDADQVSAALSEAGFDDVILHRPRESGFATEPGEDLVRIIRAEVAGS